ncbi:MAG: ferritin-like domain-containing protein, partial [Candidatus Acidiferrum sp.]
MANGKKTTITQPDRESRQGNSAGDRATLIKNLNEDLAREYQAIISYVIYSQVLTGPEYMDVATELEKHAAEELKHAIIISKQIDYLGGMPTAEPKPVHVTDDNKEM